MEITPECTDMKRAALFLITVWKEKKISSNRTWKIGHLTDHMRIYQHQWPCPLRENLISILTTLHLPSLFFEHKYILLNFVRHKKTLKGFKDKTGKLKQFYL